jgi:hypothetical protein
MTTGERPRLRSVNAAREPHMPPPTTAIRDDMKIRKMP